MPHLNVCVLGSLQILVAGRPVGLESEKARALLVYLIVEADRPHRRETLVGLLWPDSPEDLARGNLRQALYSLRQAIGDAAADPPYLLISRDEIQFNTASDCTLDVALFQTDLSRSDCHSHAQLESCASCAALLEDAAATYHGRFLEQFFLKDSAEFEEWALMRRESLHRRALEALDHLANHHLQRAQYHQARRYAQRQLELDPWREEAHRQLMRVLAAGGQRSSALEEYEVCRRVLREELGVELSAETRELHGQISRGELTPVRAEQRPVSVNSRRPLPAQLTPFLGRERELTEVGRLLSDEKCRLITLVGPGGVGKTRLALEAAAQQSTSFRDGAAFVSLASVSAAALIPPAMAGALGFDFYGPLDPQAQLLSFLRDKQMLLIVDNVEHLLEAAGWWVEILQTAPEVKLLLTSRESLNLQGEWVFELEGLAVPESDQVEGLDRVAAAALFLQRAHRAHVGFELLPEERHAVARLCRLVGGIPLALELAATWVRTLSCTEILRELEGSLDILTTSVRDLAERHRSLTAVFDQSWKLLTPDEQRVLARLSVFHGGFVREAAERVAGSSLPTLSALVTKSLVRRTATGRYALHELVRQYATARLALDPEAREKTAERQSHYYLGLLEQRDSELRSCHQKATLEELTTEIDNLRAAWSWAIARGDISRVYRASATMWYLFQHHNWFVEGESLFRHAAEMLQAQVAEGEAAAVQRDAVSAMLAHSGFFAFSRGKIEAYATLSASADCLRSSEDARTSSYALWYRGLAAWGLGEYAEASESFQASLARAREAGDLYYDAAAGTYLGVVEHELGDYERARYYFTGALAVARKLGDVMLLAHLLSYLSVTLLSLGEHSSAEKLLHESLTLGREIRCRSSEALALDALGQVGYLRGNPEEARAFFAAAGQIFREIDSRPNLARVLCHQGLNSRVLGAFDDARDDLTASLRIASESGLVASELDALAGLAALPPPGTNNTVRSVECQALEMAVKVVEHPASTQSARNLAAQARSNLEANLTPEQTATAQDRAHSEDLAELVQQVLAFAYFPTAAS